MEELVNRSFWQDRRVLVTGATGLVGSWLTSSLLERGAQVTALVHHPDPQALFYSSGTYQRTSVVQGGLEDMACLEHAVNKYEIDTVFHIGAQAIVSAAHHAPWLTFEANVRGTYNLLEVCRRHPDRVSRIVVASSDKAYGTQEQLPYVETMPLAGLYPYEVSKSCADLIAQSYAHTYQMPIAVARCGNIYGGGDLNWSRIVPDAIRACWSRRPVQIRSDGTFIRDYIYVKDVAMAYLAIAEQLDNDPVRGQAFNFSPNKPLNVLEIVGHIQRLMDCESIRPDVLNTAQGEIHSQYLDSSKAKSVLGWQPQFDLDRGLSETITWYRAYLEAHSGSAA